MRSKLFRSFALAVAAIVASSLVACGSATAQWAQTNGPYGGDVRALGVLGTNLFASIYETGDDGCGGVFKSTDNGATWHPSRAGLMDAEVRTFLAVGTTLYAGTSRGVFLTTDSGANWVQTKGIMTAVAGNLDSSVYALTMIGRTLIAGTYNPAGVGGIHLSSDSGATWTLAAAQNDGVFAFVSLGTDLFAGDYDLAVTRSTDSGKTWSVPNQDITGRSVRSLAVIGTDLYAGAGDGVYRSIDRGITWTPANKGLPTPPERVSAIAAMGSTLFVGISASGLNAGLYRSTDGGQNWTLASEGLLGSAVAALAVAGSDLYAATGYNTGVSRSTNQGNSWTWTSVDMPCSEVSVIATHDLDLYAGTHYSGLAYSSDAGNTWALMGGGLPENTSVSAIAFIDNTAFASVGGSLYRSSDGTNWTPINSGLLHANYRYVLTTMGSELFAGLSGGVSTLVFRSSDFGDTWIAAGSGLPESSFGATIDGFAVLRSNIFALTYNGVYRSIDSGASWKETASTTTGASHVKVLAVSGSTLLAGTSDSGVIRSDDNGVSWTSANKGIPNSIDALLVSGKNIFGAATPFASTASHIYVSTNDGADWKDVSDGLSAGMVSSLAVDATNLYAASTTAGVWRRPLREVLPMNAVSNPIGTPEPARNYPNPFARSTTISFTLDAPTTVQISIVNPLGMTVGNIFSGELGRGEHRFPWAGSSALPDGVYECVVISTNGNIQRLQMMLMR